MATTKKLSDILGAKKGVDLEFIDLVVDETNGGEPLVRLTLKNPLGAVTGRMISDNVSGQRARLTATDVEVVSIGKDALNAIEDMEKAGETVFTWDVEGKSGKMTCNLKLDVSNALEVWVVTESFAKFGANRRRDIREQRTSALIKKINDDKTKKEFKDTDVNNAGGGKAGADDKKPEPVAKAG